MKKNAFNLSVDLFCILLGGYIYTKDLASMGVVAIVMISGWAMGFYTGYRWK